MDVQVANITECKTKNFMLTLKSFTTIPGLGSLSKLYFGAEKGTESLYSLIKLNSFSGFLPPLSVTDMLTESVVVDSALIFFQTTENYDSD